MGQSGKDVWAHAKTITDPKEQALYLLKATKWLKKQMDRDVKWKWLPVDPWTFVHSTKYLNMGEEVWPLNMVEIEKLLTGDYDEAVFTGGIGTGKTTCALVAIAYVIYELSCMEKPHRAFDMAASSEIMFIFQSMKKELSKAVDYNRFKSMLDNSPYFCSNFQYSKLITSELRFPHNIIVKPLSGDATAAIGQNVFGGLIDEVNFMEVTEDSKKSGADGGTYDQAKAIYNSIARRRESRFMIQGKLPGLLCLVSSKRYPGEFTDVKMRQAEADLAATGKTAIFVYDKRSWDVKPAHNFTGLWFDLFLGDANRKPRILKDGESESFSADDQKLVLKVPLEFRAKFEEDIFNNIRDIAGHSTLALHPFIMNVEALSACFNTVPSILSREWCDFEQTGLLIYPERFTNPHYPRWIHIDPSSTVDSTGVACAHVVNFVPINRGEEIELLPVIRFDFTLEVRPPPGGEIELSNVRRLIYKLSKAGLNVKYVSLDSMQSKDTLHELAKKGYKSGYQSVDTDWTPYEVSKLAFYDGRILTPEHDHVKREWTRLERNTQKQKIDHPANGSKDVSDAMAGAIYGLTMRREIWTAHGIPLSMVPKSLLAKKQPDHKGSVSDVEKREKAKEGA
ncbi:terminase large subunit protein [Rhizobium phage RHph_Y1_11]|nr:terminase large subunit protein [Rhizobium phage RHph_Y1_11]